MWRRVLVVFIALLAFAPAAVHAAPSEGDRSAARHFADGQKAFTAGDYARAADEFEAAYRDKPHHAPLWNAARSLQRAGEDVRAANLYARYLREAPADAPDRDQATVALRALNAQLGRIELHATGGVLRMRLDGREVDAPIVYVAPGEHVAEGESRTGSRVRKVVTVGAHEQVSVTLAPEVAPTPRPATPPPVGPERSSRPLPPLVTLIGGALTAAAGGFTIVAGLDTVSKRDAFLDDRNQSRLDNAFSSQTRTNVLLGTTIGLGVVTGVIALFFTDWDGPPAIERATTMAGAR